MSGLSREPTIDFGSPRGIATDRRQTAQGRNWALILYRHRENNGTRIDHVGRRIAKPIEESIGSDIKVMTNQKSLLPITDRRCTKSSVADLSIGDRKGNFSNCTRSSGSGNNFLAYNGNESEWSGRLIMSATSWIASKSVLEPRERVGWTLHRKLRRCKRCEFDENYLLHEASTRKITYHIGQQRMKLPESGELAKTPRVREGEEDGSEEVGDGEKHRRELESILRISDKSQVMDRFSHQRTWCAGQKPTRRQPVARGFSMMNLFCMTLILFLSINELFSNQLAPEGRQAFSLVFPSMLGAEASLIIGDSAIEIQEVDSDSSNNHNREPQPAQQSHEQPNQVIFGSTSGIASSLDGQMNNAQQESVQQRDQMKMPGPLPPISNEDITDGDKKSRASHDYDINELNLKERQAEKNVLNHVLSGTPMNGHQSLEDKTIAGKVVDFELTPAGGHNKAKIKKKKKKMSKQSMFKKWGKKKESEKKAHEKKHKESMKKKKEEGHKGKKKWGKEEHGLKKKGKFKKKKWGKKVKKGKGVKKGKKGKKFLKDVGHKNTGFKTVYHKEEWGKSSKWHDIKRQKKWDEKSKKWKKKWKKEKGKKYKGDHMKKFEKKKKSGKKYKKEKEDKFKKYKKEKFEKGKKKKMEEKAKKKESGAKKHMKEMKKKKKKEG